MIDWAGWKEGPHIWGGSPFRDCTEACPYQHNETKITLDISRHKSKSTEFKIYLRAATMPRYLPGFFVTGASNENADWPHKPHARYRFFCKRSTLHDIVADKSGSAKQGFNWLCQVIQVGWSHSASAPEELCNILRRFRQLNRSNINSVQISSWAQSS